MGWIKDRMTRQLIASADSPELSEMVRMLVRRYAELFEEEEVVFLSLPKHDREERLRILAGVLDFEKNHS